MKVQLVTPMFVGTNMISYSHMATKCNIFVPNAEQYVKSAVKKLDKCSKTNGYWAHGVQVCQNCKLARGVTLCVLIECNDVITGNWGVETQN